jgi:antitoxin (DNA-binding transcriptional repressor) of toxin-antitoxin stability system
MARRISQRELRNDSGAIMRALARGETFTVTRNGVAIADLVPHRRATFVGAEEAVAAFAASPPIDFERFRADIDAQLGVDPEPRA